MIEKLIVEILKALGVIKPFGSAQGKPAPAYVKVKGNTRR